MSLINGFDPFKVLKAALGGGGEYADIYFEDTANTSVVAEENRIEKIITGRDRGAGVRVISGLKTYYAYTNDLTEKGLLEVAAIVAKGARGGKEAGAVGLMKKQKAPGFDIKEPAHESDLKDKVSLVNRANSTAWAHDKRIRQVRVMYGDAFRKIALVNSLGDLIEEDRCALLLVCNAVSSEGDNIQTGYEPVGGIMGLEAFKEPPPESIAETAARRAIRMLSAQRAPGGKMPVVLSSDAGGTMIHEAVGHGLEADLAFQNLSVYSGKMGQQVASELVTVIDDATIPHKRGSFFFDDEGTPAEKTVLVENGILK
ncbi:partial TldD protein, partial [Anaerolineae bacterium]